MSLFEVLCFIVKLLVAGYCAKHMFIFFYLVKENWRDILR